MKTTVKRLNLKNAGHIAASFFAGVILSYGGAFLHRGVFLPAAASVLPAVPGIFFCFGGAFGAALFTSKPYIISFTASAFISVLTRLWFSGQSKRRYPLAVTLMTGFTAFSGNAAADIILKSGVYDSGLGIAASLISGLAVYVISEAYENKASCEKSSALLPALLVCCLSAFDIGIFSPAKIVCVLLSFTVILTKRRENSLLSVFVLCVGLCLWNGISSLALIMPLFCILIPKRSAEKRRLVSLIFIFFAASCLVILGATLSDLASCLIASMTLLLIPDGLFGKLSKAVADKEPPAVRTLGKKSFMLSVIDRLLMSAKYNEENECTFSDEEFSAEEHRISRANSYAMFRSMLLAARDTASDCFAVSDTVLYSEKLREYGIHGCELGFDDDLCASAYFNGSERINEEKLRYAVSELTSKKQILDLRSEESGTVRLLFTPEAEYTFEAGGYQIAKDPESGIGDRMSLFTLGRYAYAVLSDGMGTGEEAGKSCELMLYALKELIYGGFSPVSAIRLASAYLGCCSQTESFATLCLMRFDLILGKAKFFKCGEGNSWLWSESGATVIPGGGLPLGIMDEPAVMESEVSVDGFEYVIIQSDGCSAVSAFDIDSVLGERAFAGGEGVATTSPEELAGMLASEAFLMQNDKTRDDITVIVLRIKKNK